MRCSLFLFFPPNLPLVSLSSTNVSDSISCLWNLSQLQHRIFDFTFIAFPSRWKLYKIVRYCIWYSTSILLDLELMWERPGWKTCYAFSKSSAQIFKHVKLFRISVTAYSSLLECAFASISHPFKTPFLFETSSDQPYFKLKTASNRF